MIITFKDSEEKLHEISYIDDITYEEAICALLDVYGFITIIEVE